MHLHRQVLNRADHIATISEKTKEDIVHIFGIEDERITITHQSVSIPDEILLIGESTVCDDLESTFNLMWKGYFLHFGAIEPKKNLGRIVEAYLSTATSTPLVIVGSRGWLDEDQTALINQVRRIGGASSDRIHLYEYMSRRMLLNLIRGAKATLFPSLYEGFGLPILESMLLSTPVLTSRGGATEEVAGEAAVLVDPYDVSSIAAGLRAIDLDNDLRAELSLKGIARARVFSPTAYQARLEELYLRVG